MQDFFFRDVWRMDWGLGNPNKTAALIAMLMIAVWGFAYIRKWGFWVALVAFTGLGACLIHTFSRGGLIALFVGMIPLIACAPRPWPKVKLIALTISVWIMIGFAIYLNAHERLGQGVVKEDRSISHRVQLWKAAPVMMVDAPSGWGWGKSGQAYMQWYQPLEKSETYRTLVNSHLTWLVEWGWLGRFAYVLSWGILLLLCWPNKESVWRMIPLGVWLSLAVGAFFSSVGESPWVWIVPVLGLFVVLVGRMRKKEWPRLIHWSLPVLGSFILLSFLWFVGQGSSLVQKKNGNVVHGSGPVERVCFVDTKVMGISYGRTWRSFLAKNPPQNGAILFLEGPNASADFSKKVVYLTGSAGNSIPLKETIDSAKRVVFLNPAQSPQSLNFNSAKVGNVTVIFGELAQTAAAQAWAQVVPVQQIPGAGDYLPNWPRLLNTAP
jgi:hypothetical protein